MVAPVICLCVSYHEYLWIQVQRGVKEGWVPPRWVGRGWMKVEHRWGEGSNAINELFSGTSNLVSPEACVESPIIPIPRRDDAGTMSDQCCKRWTGIIPELSGGCLTPRAWWEHAREHDTLNQCWFNVGPPSATLANNNTTLAWCLCRTIRCSSVRRDLQLN